MLRISLWLPLVFIFSTSDAQEIVQNIRGQITDGSSSKALPFVNVILKGSEPIIGTTADGDGHYLLEGVAPGRYDIEISHLGYETVMMREVLVTSSKEVVLDFQLMEQIETLDEVVVRPKVSKSRALNPMTTVSAKMLSVEEASRYAGGFDDPARLATTFAGVTSGISNNAIIVRGNAPRFMQWKIENVEIPNPNHFADLAVFGGGGLTALSSNLLANSDFLTGAFPATYNNAISGVFDMKMRSGNDTEFEHSIELGAIGVDLSSEGPISKEAGASYLINYRYSTLGLISPLLPEDAKGTNYQDVSFKVRLPKTKAGSFYLWGLGLIDHSNSSPEREVERRRYTQDIEQQIVGQSMGAIGLSNQVSISNRSFINSTLAFTTNGVDLETNRFDHREVMIPQNKILKLNHNLILSSYIHTKYSAGHSNRTGASVTRLGYDFNFREYQSDVDHLVDAVSVAGASYLMSAYTTSALSHRNWTFNLGLNGQLFTLNSNYTIEPRVGVTYQLNERSKLGFAYGLHSRLESLNIYLANTHATNTMGNMDLDFTKAHHLVLSYDLNIGPNVHIRAEPYFQFLTGVPSVGQSSSSLINLQHDWFVTELYKNIGAGRNYGLDITIERYMQKGFYYLWSGSLFQSHFRTGSNVWYPTRFNKGFVSNFLVGKEFRFSNRQRILGVNFRLTALGGDRYSPINQRESEAQRDVVFDESAPFSQQTKPSAILHFTLSYEWFRAAKSHKLSLKVLNATNEKEFQGFRYNLLQNTVDEFREAIIIPNFSYKYAF